MKTTNKKYKRTYKPKIRWDVLGLSDPRLDDTTTSIETIRKEVSLLANRGFGEETTLRSTAQNAKGRGQGRQLLGSRTRRRGATE
jgi:hypothetical protein